MRIQVVIALLILLTSFSNNMNAQTKMNNNQTLDAKQQSIVTISALTAVGHLGNLQKALNGCLDSRLTVNEVKEVLAQLYAYCGFPRSLNGINTFMSVLEERKKKGIKDETGKTATPITDTADKYERGRKTLERLTGQPQSKPAKGFGEFSPTIDRFLKEHLFADIFVSDVLNYDVVENKVEIVNYVLTHSRNLHPSATLKIKIDGQVFEENAQGDGQYDAFMNALKKVYHKKQIKLPELTDYAVRIPPGGKTDALCETIITWNLNNKDIKTRGLDSDQTVSAIKATEKMLNLIN